MFDGDKDQQERRSETLERILDEAEMGRKSKDIDDYVLEYSEFDAVSLKGMKMFTCKTCRTTVDIEYRAVDNIKGIISLDRPERKEVLTVENSAVRIFLDFSEEVQRHWTTFLEAKKKTKNHGNSLCNAVPSQEIWDWQDQQPQVDPERKQWTDCPQCHRLKSKGPSRSVAMPSAEEMQQERQRAMAAVASLGGGRTSFMSIENDEGKQDMESNGESSSSTAPRIDMPAVTPGTSDDII
ncbi:hypothetical protein NDU88_001788 [Pleurodeles waltl]|uniref:Uncharacterized protein n=1 Tax=Pleurodeles waltl TaxID=8319 RepID=A0AAV7Q9U0_PLEWA|nr:hypothetical protein NDU88_001788 [Pleurodeles waltl]